jgi:hypothetical protein
MSTSFQIGLWLLGIGLVPAGIGAFAFLRTLRFLRTAQTTSGVVNEVLFMPVSDGHIYRPKITFTTQTGETVPLTSVLDSSRQEFRVGQEVPVIYDPGHPSRARLRSFTSLWLVSLIFGAVGAFPFILGLILMIFNHN